MYVNIRFTTNNSPWKPPLCILFVTYFLLMTGLEMLAMYSREIVLSSTWMLLMNFASPLKLMGKKMTRLLNVSSATLSPMVNNRRSNFRRLVMIQTNLRSFVRSFFNSWWEGKKKTGMISIRGYRKRVTLKPNTPLV